MPTWTGIEIAAERNRLEQEAAMLLGLIVFEYSRLDMELGLMLVNSDDGHSVECLTRKLTDDGFHKRLTLLAKLANAKYGHTAKRANPYKEWLAEANRIRNIRNELFHGRWGIEPTRGKVTNVIGLPTSSEQRSVEYSIAGLQSVLETMRRLRTELDGLHDKWPI